MDRNLGIPIQSNSNKTEKFQEKPKEKPKEIRSVHVEKRTNLGWHLTH